MSGLWGEQAEDKSQGMLGEKKSRNKEKELLFFYHQCTGEFHLCLPELLFDYSVHTYKCIVSHKSTM